MAETTPASVGAMSGMSSMLQAFMKRITRTGELRSRISSYSSELQESPDSKFAQQDDLDNPFQQDFGTDFGTTPQELFDSPAPTQDPMQDMMQNLMQDPTQDISDAQLQPDPGSVVATVGEDVAAIRETIDEVKTVFSALTDVVYYMPITPAPASAGTVDPAAIEEIQQKLQTVETRLSEGSVAVITAEVKSDDAISRISDVEKTISEVISKQTETSDRLVELQELVNRDSSLTSARLSDLATYNEHIGGLYECLDDMYVTVSALTDDVSGILDVVGAVDEERSDGACGRSGYDRDCEIADVEIVPPATCVKLKAVGNEASQVMIVMELLDFLLDLVGPNNLPSILDYYVEIGWISENARLELLAYASGMEYYCEKADWKLSAEDHLKSLWFIENLCGVRFDKTRLLRVENEIARVRKGIDVLYEI